MAVGLLALPRPGTSFDPGTDIRSRAPRCRAQCLNAASTGQKTRVSISANPLIFGSLALAWALRPPREREGRRADASLRRGRRYGGGTARATASGHLVRPWHGHP